MHTDGERNDQASAFIGVHPWFQCVAEDTPSKLGR
jgi:hypothetical protein